jgi:ABC-type multidrug transport system fused ATPase/permease subunit
MIFGAGMVGQSAIFTTDYQKAKVAAANIFQIIDRQPLILKTMKEKQSEQTITFRDVHFSYPGRREAKILNGVSFCANKGQTVALVGSNGCGKSTCIQLIERFYDCDSGQVVRKLYTYKIII